MAQFPYQIDTDLRVNGHVELDTGARLAHLPVRALDSRDEQMTSADKGKILVANPSTSRTTLTLTSIDEEGMDGVFVRIKNSSHRNTVRVSAQAGQTIGEGEQTYLLSAGEWIDLVAFQAQRRWILTSGTLPYRQEVFTRGDAFFVAMPGVMHILDCTSNAVRAIVPRADSVPHARFYFFALNADATRKATIRPSRIESIHGLWNGDASTKQQIEIERNGQSVNLISNGTEWFIVGGV